MLAHDVPLAAKRNSGTGKVEKRGIILAWRERVKAGIFEGDSRTHRITAAANSSRWYRS